MGHLNYLQGDIAEMLDLTRKIENYDATLPAMQAAGKPIEPVETAHFERRQRGERLAYLRDKWGI